MMAVMTSFLVDVRMGGWKIEAKALHPVTCCPKPLSLLTHWRGGDSMYLLGGNEWKLFLARTATPAMASAVAAAAAAYLCPRWRSDRMTDVTLIRSTSYYCLQLPINPVPLLPYIL